MAYLQENKCICGRSLRRKKKEKEKKTYLKNNIRESIDEWIKKRGYDGILFSFEKERNPTVSCNNMDEL